MYPTDEVAFLGAQVLLALYFHWSGSRLKDRDTRTAAWSTRAPPWASLALAGRASHVQAQLDLSARLEVKLAGPGNPDPLGPANLTQRAF